jgi:hypothetical protein
MMTTPTPTLEEVLELARKLSIADQQRLVKLLHPPNIEIKAGRRGPGSVPCLLCPVCSSDRVEMRRPKRRHLDNGAEELSIEFHCLTRKHSWGWVLSDGEGEIFFQVLEKGETTK